MTTSVAASTEKAVDKAIEKRPGFGMEGWIRCCLRDRGWWNLVRRVGHPCHNLEFCPRCMLRRRGARRWSRFRSS